ncbi:hypothetical protein [Actinacidiphila acididurans]|uniref:Uncharacterized protein n=1 Tax=Actinacidiphila acididurans TaxID=2784346 RepID=A0ABS2U382_9ACTN|nr:hypothetical protein [Actinacidiphila acididurans]MBM9510039.1 hypothetical protein [Actinacidiphila acididurans]
MTLKLKTVVGLDPSLTGTGIASSLGWCEVIGYTPRPNPLTGKREDHITKLPHRERMAAMRDVRNRVVTTIGCPDLVVMELPAPSRSGGGAHERAWLWWELYYTLTGGYVPVALMPNNGRALYATGKGNASKTAVVDAVARRWPQWTTEGNDNAADAVVLMAAGKDWLKQSVGSVPQTHRKALEKTIWPEFLDAEEGEAA